MGEFSKIEWTTHTFNPWIGCQKVSPGCDNCYAEAMMDKRYGRVKWGPHGERKRTSVANWRKPLQWAKAVDKLRALHQPSTRPRVFCASLADVFDNQVPEVWRSDLFALIEETPDLDWLLLTKRPENIAKMLWPKWDGRLPSNIWLGTTCEDEANFERRWSVLSKIPARVRFISYEPALGPIDLMRLRNDAESEPDWIICGGESGPNKRPMLIEWAYSMADQCEILDIPFFMKQIDKVRPIPDDLMIRQFPPSPSDEGK